MTKKYPKPNPVAFANDLAEYRAACKELYDHDNRADPDKGDVLYERCAEAEDKVLDQHAPDISAVAEKLMILWDEDIWFENEEATQMQKIIGDLRRLARSRR